MNPDIDDLDESRRRRRDVPKPKVDLNHIHPPRQFLGPNNNEHVRGSSSVETTNAVYSCPHNDQQQQVAPTYRVPQHLQQHKIRAIIGQHFDRLDNDDSLSSSAKDLDAKLSGLQSAAIKTALLINGKAIRKSIHRGEVVTTEEIDEDQYSHWIFRKHVGFSSSEGRKSYLHDFPPPQLARGANGNNDNIQRQLKQSFSGNYIISSGEETATELTDDTIRTIDYKDEKSELLQQLNYLRRQRRQIQQSIIPAIYQHLSEWNCRLSSSQHSYNNALSTSEAVRAKREWVAEELRVTSKCHVLGDVFLIWHRGPFGTINGFRLGKSALTMAGTLRRSGGHDEGRPGNGGGSSLLSWISSDNTGPATSNAPQTTNTSGVNVNATPDKVLIPWNEINSALGQVLLLLYTLQHLPHSGISFQRHVLLPCGSASKIGIVKKQSTTTSLTPSSSGKQSNERRTITALAAYKDDVQTDTLNSISDPSSKRTTQLSRPSPHSHPPGNVTWYNLYHYEENGSLLSIGYYARRNFNIALEGLLHCIAEAFLVVEKRDMALAAPYTMIIDGIIVGKDVHDKEEFTSVNNCEASVGGLPIAYDPAKGEEWTMVCKYLLTNLKWLVTYTAKHIDT
ncbi:hypothetical protein ACHAXH_006049 [Discostella pseudostelligera]